MKKKTVNFFLPDPRRQTNKNKHSYLRISRLPITELRIQCSADGFVDTDIDPRLEQCAQLAQQRADGSRLAGGQRAVRGGMWVSGWVGEGWGKK